MATTHVAYSRVAVTDVLLTTLCTVALALLVTGRIEWAGVALGLAASAKYPGALLAVPLVVAAWGAWRRLALAGALAVLAFVVTSPFVVWHAGAALDDIPRVRDLARDGWLGLEDDPIAPLAIGERLWDALGPALLVGLAALVVLALRRTRADLVLLAFAAAWTLQLLPLGTHFDRYVLPLVPVLGVAAGSLRRAAPVFAVLLAIPLAWSVADARSLRGEDTRLQADAWIARNVPARDRIAADPSTLPLEGRDVVRLELPGPGRAFDPRALGRDAARRRRPLGARERGGRRSRARHGATSTPGRRASTTRSSVTAWSCSPGAVTSPGPPARGCGWCGSEAERRGSTRPADR